jgi:hypothetical protein
MVGGDDGEATGAEVVGDDGEATGAEVVGGDDGEATGAAVGAIPNTKEQFSLLSLAVQHSFALHI